MKTKTTWAMVTRQRIKSGELAESIIRTMRIKLANVFNNQTFACRDGRKGACNESEALYLLSLIKTYTPAVSDEQARKGADWLYKSVFTSKGAQRSTEFAQQFTPADLQVIRELQVNPQFKLIRFEETEYNRWVTFFPVYRAIGSAGSFEYEARAWQSGGNSFVLEHA